MAVKLTEAELSQWDKKTITMAGRNIDLYISKTIGYYGDDVIECHAVDGYQSNLSWLDNHPDLQLVAEMILQFLEEAEEADVV